MDNSKNQLKSGIILSYLNLAISTLIPMLYTPIMLRILGQEEYGLYSLANTTIGYLSLLSFGFGGTILRYLSFYRAKGMIEEERRVFGFFLKIYSAIAVLVIVGGVILTKNASAIFSSSLSSQEVDKISVLMLIITMSSALTFPISVFSSVAMAHEKYLFRKIIDLISTVAVPLANLVVLYLGYASIGMVTVSLLIHFLLLPIYVIYCIKILKITPSLKSISKEVVKEILRFSAFVFLGTIVDMLFWSTDKFLLGIYLGTVAVAVYNIGSTFNSMFVNLSSALTNVMGPRITAMVAQRDEKKELSDLFIRVGRLQYIVIALAVTGFAVFGRHFIRMWAGTEYSDAYWIAIVTMFPLCIPLIQNTGISIITAQNKHAFRSVVYLIIAVVNVISTALVIPSMGGLGAAICSGVSYIVGQAFIMNYYYWKKIGLDVPRFWKNILKMSIVPGIMLAIGIVIMRFVTIDNWLIFFVGVIGYTIVYFVAMYLTELNEYEKSLISKAFLKARKLCQIGKRKEKPNQ